MLLKVIKKILEGEQKPKLVRVSGCQPQSCVMEDPLSRSSLFLFVHSASSIFEENYVRQGSKHSNTYSNKVFGGWDMCVTDEKAAKLRAQILANEIEVKCLVPQFNPFARKSGQFQISPAASPEIQHHTV